MHSIMGILFATVLTKNHLQFDISVAIQDPFTLIHFNLVSFKQQKFSIKSEAISNC